MDAEAGVNPMKDWLEIVNAMEEVVFPALRDKQKELIKTRQQAGDKRIRIVNFSVGQYVMARDPTRNNKLAPLYEGPFKVVRKNRGGASLLLDADGILLPRNYAPNQLIPIPTPVESDEQTYIVEEILKHRQRKSGGYDYQVKWKHHKLPSWEPQENFVDVAVISRYWRSLV